jgi:hypothetical protein
MFIDGQGQLSWAEINHPPGMRNPPCPTLVKDGFNKSPFEKGGFKGIGVFPVKSGKLIFCQVALLWHELPLLDKRLSALRVKLTATPGNANILRILGTGTGSPRELFLTETENRKPATVSYR